MYPPIEVNQTMIQMNLLGEKEGMDNGHESVSLFRQDKSETLEVGGYLYKKSHQWQFANCLKACLRRHQIFTDKVN